MILCILCQGVPKPLPANAPAYGSTLLCGCGALRVDRIDAYFRSPGERHFTIHLGFDWTGQWGTFVGGYGLDEGWASRPEVVVQAIDEFLCDVVLDA